MDPMSSSKLVMMSEIMGESSAQAEALLQACGWDAEKAARQFLSRKWKADASKAVEREKPLLEISRSHGRPCERSLIVRSASYDPVLVLLLVTQEY